MCFSLKTLISIIRTGLPILVELIDLDRSVIISLPPISLLKSLNFLLGSLTVTLSPALLDFLLSSDTSVVLHFPSIGKF